MIYSNVFGKLALACERVYTRWSEVVFGRSSWNDLFIIVWDENWKLKKIFPTSPSNCSKIILSTRVIHGSHRSNLSSYRSSAQVPADHSRCHNDNDDEDEHESSSLRLFSTQLWWWDSFSLPTERVFEIWEFPSGFVRRTMKMKMCQHLYDYTNSTADRDFKRKSHNTDCCNLWDDQSFSCAYSRHYCPSSG